MEVEEVHGCLSAGTEVRAFIQNEVQVGFQGLVVQMVDGCQFIDAVLLKGELELSGEEQDGMVSRCLRVVDSSQRGRWRIVAVQGYIQVADVVNGCGANFWCHVF